MPRTTLRLIGLSLATIFISANAADTTPANPIRQSVLLDHIKLLSSDKFEGRVEEVFKNIIQALNRGEKIELRGFGSFRVRSRDARRGRNPKTGEPVDIPAKRVPYFKPGKELKELINDGVTVPGNDDDSTDGDAA